MFEPTFRMTKTLESQNRFCRDQIDVIIKTLLTDTIVHCSRHFEKSLEAHNAKP